MYRKLLNCHIILCGTKTCADVTGKELETGFVSPAGYVAEISPVYLNFTHFRLTDLIIGRIAASFLLDTFFSNVSIHY